MRENLLLKTMTFYFFNDLALNKMHKPIFSLFFLLTYLLNAQTVTNHELKPKGVYKEIDFMKEYKAIQSLSGKNKKIKQQTLDNVLKQPNNYNPTALYAISRELFNLDKKDSASFWFYVGQIRARYDANLCMDISAKQAVSVLNQEYGNEINQYAFENLDTLKANVTNAVEFVRANEEKYDHRWINLYGMQAVQSSFGNDNLKEISQPKSKWAEIKQKTLDDYYGDFLQAYARFKKMKK